MSFLVMLLSAELEESDAVTMSYSIVSPSVNHRITPFYPLCAKAPSVRLVVDRPFFCENEMPVITQHFI